MGLFNNDEPVAVVTSQVLVEEPKVQIVTPSKPKKSMFGRSRSNSIEPSVTPSVVSDDTFKNTTTGLMNVLSIRGINQVYTSGDKKSTVLQNFNLDIEDIPGEGQFVSLLGKSGCGKCFSENTKITVRNKTTMIIEEISIIEFLKRFP